MAGVQTMRYGTFRRSFLVSDSTPQTFGVDRSGIGSGPSQHQSYPLYFRIFVGILTRPGQRQTVDTPPQRTTRVSLNLSRSSAFGRRAGSRGELLCCAITIILTGPAGQSTFCVQPLFHPPSRLSHRDMVLFAVPFWRLGPGREPLRVTDLKGVDSLSAPPSIVSI